MGCKYYTGCAAYIGKNEDLYVQIIDMVDGCLIFEIDGYCHRCQYGYVSKFKYSIQSMTDESYIKYINDNFLDGTELTATEVRYYKGKRTFLFINELNMVKRISTYSPRLIKDKGSRRKLYKNSYIV